MVGSLGGAGYIHRKRKAPGGRAHPSGGVRQLPTSCLCSISDPPLCPVTEGWRKCSLSGERRCLKSVGRERRLLTSACGPSPSLSILKRSSRWARPGRREGGQLGTSPTASASWTDDSAKPCWGLARPPPPKWRRGSPRCGHLREGPLYLAEKALEDRVQAQAGCGRGCRVGNRV